MDMIAVHWAGDILHLRRLAAACGLLWCCVVRVLPDPTDPAVNGRSAAEMYLSYNIDGEILTRCCGPIVEKGLPISDLTEICPDASIERQSGQHQQPKSDSTTLMRFGTFVKSEPSPRLPCGARSPMVIIEVPRGPRTL